MIDRIASFFSLISVGRKSMEWLGLMAAEWFSAGLFGE